MRRTLCGLIVLIAGCGGGGAAAPTPTRTATPAATPAEVEATATPSGPWSAARESERRPLLCPVSSSRAGWPSRVLNLGEMSYAKLWGKRPRWASVDMHGKVYDTIEIGAREPSNVRAFACWRDGRTAAAWTERRGGNRSALRLFMGRTRTIDVARSPYDSDAIGDVALAFGPDGSLLIVYSVFQEVRAAIVSPGGKVGAPFRLGPAFDVARVQAEIGRQGRAVVAWTTIDAGEERNERRRIYAVTGRDGRFGAPQLVDRARHLNIGAATYVPMRLAVASDGRALLLWGTDRKDPEDLVDPFTEDYLVRAADASPDGSFGKPRQLSSKGMPAAVALRADGAAVALWTSEDGLKAALRPPGKPFRAPGTLADDAVAAPIAILGPNTVRVEWTQRGQVYFSGRPAP